MQEKRLMDSLMKQMAHKTKNSTKLKFTNSICFHVPLVGIYFDQFRKVDQYMEMGQFVQQLIDNKKMFISEDLKEYITNTVLKSNEINVNKINTYILIVYL